MLATPVGTRRSFLMFTKTYIIWFERRMENMQIILQLYYMLWLAGSTEKLYYFIWFTSGEGYCFFRIMMKVIFLILWGNGPFIDCYVFTSIPAFLAFSLPLCIFLNTILCHPDHSTTRPVFLFSSRPHIVITRRLSLRLFVWLDHYGSAGLPLAQIRHAVFLCVVGPGRDCCVVD